MALFFLTVTLGNVFTAVVNRLITTGTLVLNGADYYWFFTWAMLGAAVLFAVATLLYRGRTYVQGEAAEVLPVGENRCTVCGASLRMGDATCPACGERPEPAVPVARR
jgi:hypothetical protein